MSVDMATVPPWKKDLMDRRRRQEDECRRNDTDVSRMSNLPQWKRDLLSKRSLQQNSLVFVGRENRLSNEYRSSDSGDNMQQDTSESQMKGDESSVSAIHSNGVEPSQMDINGENEDHLLPVNDNPWLRSDPLRQKPNAKRQSDEQTPGSHDSVANHQRWSGEIVITNDTKEVEDNVFAEEVTYGKGFVHKLLRRFSRLTSPEPEERGRTPLRTSAAKRSHSAENILDDHRTGNDAYLKRSSYTDSLSPRPPTRSQSTESISSPRSVENGYGGNKMGFLAEAETDHMLVSEDTDVRSPRSESSETEEFPRKNIVASALNVFENKRDTVIMRKPKPAPRPVRISRNSVHSLIAVDSTSVDKPNCDLSSESLSNTSQVKKRTSVELQDSSSTIDKRSTQVMPIVGVKTTSAKSPDLLNGNKNDIAKSQTHMQSPSNSEVTESKGGQSYFDLYYKGSSGRKLSNSTVPETSTQNGGYEMVNGAVDTTDNSTVAQTSPDITSNAPSFKKRKAPLPPKPRLYSKPKSPEIVNGNVSLSTVTKTTTKVTSPVILESKTQISLNETSRPSPVQSKSDTSSFFVPKTQTVSNTEEVKRPSLNLNLNGVDNKMTPEIVKGSRGGSNDAQAVISGRGNKKAKIATPKSSGPGSLLIRPASNMVHSKNAQFAKLEIKYEDIRTGSFAPPKKKPAHYDDSDESDDDDVPVTNIDDVISGNVSDDVKLAASRDKNANNARKTGKYEFIGAGVISGKSSLAKRKKTTKVNIRFRDVESDTFEYPSESSLMAGCPPSPGDYDYPDDCRPVESALSDEDEEEESGGGLHRVDTATTLLMNTPAVGTQGPLSGYQSKMQFEYHFGMNMIEEQPAPPAKPNSQTTSQAQSPTEGFVRPVDDNSTSNWSETTSSDLLF